MFRSKWFGVSLAVLFAACAPTLSRAQGLRINLCNEDQYARRRMLIVKKSGETISDVLRIRSFAAESNSFVVERIAGGTVDVAASDIKEIHFEQQPESERSVAQVAVAQIKARQGDAFRYTLSQKTLKIDDAGDLVLPESASRKKLSEPASLEGEGARDTTRILESATIAEARTLSFDPEKKSFVVDIQYVKYTKEMPETGGSTPSGIAK